MLDICLLGTGGMMPLPTRHLTSLLLRYNGCSLLIDSGEGTQVALRKSGNSSNPIDIICLTHFHGDHVSGLPGMLLAMKNSERKEKLTIIGPKGLAYVVNSLRVIAPELPFPIEYQEFTGEEADFTVSGYRIHAFRVKHRVPCYGYRIEIDRAGRFDAEKARALEIPLKCWNRLQHGETVTEEGRTFTPDMVMGPRRRGLKVCYVTDTRPVPAIAENAAGADLFICEGMYGDPERLEHVKEHTHMLMSEAAELAKKAEVKELWFTHYSPAMLHPKDYEKAMEKIFSPSVISKDGQFVSLNFEED